MNGGSTAKYRPAITRASAPGSAGTFLLLLVPHPLRGGEDSVDVLYRLAHVHHVWHDILSHHSDILVKITAIYHEALQVSGSYVNWRIANPIKDDKYRYNE